MYHQHYPNFEFFQKIEERLIELTEQHKETLKHYEVKFAKLEEENKDLKKKIEDIKPINIENINYKIQELSVDEISGSLNIGLSTLADSEELKRLIDEILGKREDKLTPQSVSENQREAAE